MILGKGSLHNFTWRFFRRRRAFDEGGNHGVDESFDEFHRRPIGFHVPS